MDRELWTTADIAGRLGLANAAVARSWVRRAGLKAVPGRQGDAKQYDSAAVLAAKEQMVGRGVGGGPKRRAS